MDRSDLTDNRRHTSHLTVAIEESDEFLAGLAATDPAAFAELYRRYATRIRWYCGQRLRDRELAEDATSQVFLKALESLQRKRVDNVAAWLFSIAHNEVIDRYRRQRDHLTWEQVGDVESPDESPEALAVVQSQVADVRHALWRLTEDQQRVIELRLAGLATRDIQEVLGRSRSWVGTTQFRALHRLRALLRDPETEETTS